jgi:hypothetical protein
MPHAILENWQIITDDRLIQDLEDGYKAPEMYPIYIQGDVYGSDQFMDGKFIATSMVQSVNGNCVTTKSGSVYQLGKPDEDYVKWCKDNGHHVPTENEPIKLKK